MISQDVIKCKTLMFFMFTVDLQYRCLWSFIKGNFFYGWQDFSINKNTFVSADHLYNSSRRLYFVTLVFIHFLNDTCQYCTSSFCISSVCVVQSFACVFHLWLCYQLAAWGFILEVVHRTIGVTTNDQKLSFQSSLLILFDTCHSWQVPNHAWKHTL